MESNDSPEIPDGGKTSDIPGQPSWQRKMILFGGEKRRRKKEKKENGPLVENDKDRKSKRVRQKNKRLGKGNRTTALRFQTGGRGGEKRVLDVPGPPGGIPSSGFIKLTHQYIQAHNLCFMPTVISGRKYSQEHQNIMSSSKCFLPNQPLRFY